MDRERPSSLGRAAQNGRAARWSAILAVVVFALPSALVAPAAADPCLVSVAGQCVPPPPQIQAGPQACFDVVPPGNPKPGETWIFDAWCSTDTPPYGHGDLQYGWDFGDGSSTAFMIPDKTTHAYDAPGEYTVCLTVVDPASIANVKCVPKAAKVLDKQYEPSAGWINISRVGNGGIMIEEWYTTLHPGLWNCGSSTSATLVIVQCRPIKNNPGFDGWQCWGMVLNVVVPTQGSQVKGTASCDNKNAHRDEMTPPPPTVYGIGEYHDYEVWHTQPLDVTTCTAENFVGEFHVQCNEPVLPPKVEQPVPVENPLDA